MDDTMTQSGDTHQGTPLEQAESPAMSLALPRAEPQGNQGDNVGGEDEAKFRSQTFRCSALTKAGKPCRSTSVGEDGLCAYHGGRTRLDSVEAGKKSGEKRREMAKSLRQRLADAVEAEAETLIKAYLKGARDGDWRAADALITRVHGKPKETVEHRELPTDPAKLLSMSSEELDALEAQLLGE